MEFDRLNSKRIASDSESAKTIQTHQSSEINKDETVTQLNRPVAQRHKNKQHKLRKQTTQNTQTCQTDLIITPQQRHRTHRTEHKQRRTTPQKSDNNNTTHKHTQTHMNKLRDKKSN